MTDRVVSLCGVGVGLLGLLLVTTTWAAERPPERHLLYTRPDPSSSGGLAGRVTRPQQPLLQVLAIPADAPHLVYEGTIEGPDRRTFRFEGLPMRTYDLVAVFEEAFYEGLRLHRGTSTLTAADREQIEAAILASEPFYNEKTVHRLEGATGQGSFARAICTFLRSRSSGFALAPQDGKWERADFRRTFKIVILKDVGPGWQIVRSRDLYPVWARPDRPAPRHLYRRELARIRVTDTVKDVGPIDLGE
jgi:hypothetical protein